MTEAIALLALCPCFVRPSGDTDAFSCDRETLSISIKGLGNLGHSGQAAVHICTGVAGGELVVQITSKVLSTRYREMPPRDKRD